MTAFRLSMRAARRGAFAAGLSAVLLALPGCTTFQDFGDRLRSEGKGTLALGNEWKKGDAMIKRGNKLIRQGRDDIEGGRKRIRRGESRIAEGRDMIEKGQRLKRRAEGSYDENRVY